MLKKLERHALHEAPWCTERFPSFTPPEVSRTRWKVSWQKAFCSETMSRRCHRCVVGHRQTPRLVHREGHLHRCRCLSCCRCLSLPVLLCCHGCTWWGFHVWPLNEDSSGPSVVSCHMSFHWETQLLPHRSFHVVSTFPTKPSARGLKKAGGPWQHRGRASVESLWPTEVIFDGLRLYFREPEEPVKLSTATAWPSGISWFHRGVWRVLFVLLFYAFCRRLSRWGGGRWHRR